MSLENGTRTGKTTPMERIFERVVGRKMTSFERICFHLKTQIKPPPKMHRSDQASRANNART